MNKNTAIQRGKPKFSAMLQTEKYQAALQRTLTSPKEIQKFTAAITSVVSTNPAIEECTASTILSAALCGHALGLAPSPQLGLYYIVPFKENKEKVTKATFVLGYKGYIQLAIRSGQYKKLNVLEIKEGELVNWDPLNEDIEVRLISDYAEREAAKTIGYYATFEYTNGFRKALYWTREKMEAHALKYSKGYSSDRRKGTSYTFWSKDFDGMAKKTMLRQLISKWGIMSVEMQDAYLNDGAVLDDHGKAQEYASSDFDNDKMIDVSELSSEPDIADDLPFDAPPENDSGGQQFSLDDLTE